VFAAQENPTALAAGRVMDVHDGSEAVAARGLGHEADLVAAILNLKTEPGGVAVGQGGDTCTPGSCSPGNYCDKGTKVCTQSGMLGGLQDGPGNARPDIATHGIGA